METLGLQSVGDVFFGNSLITNQPMTIEDKTPQPLDQYVPASVGSLASAPAATTTKKIEEIANNPLLTDKEKRAQINALRKQLGISKGEMKKLYMKPLERKAEMEGDETKKKLYASMYKPGGCVKKVFKGIGKGFATIGKVALGVASVVFNPINAIPMLSSAIGRIPGVGKAVNAVDGAVDKVSGKIDEARNFLEVRNADP